MRYSFRFIVVLFPFLVEVLSQLGQQSYSLGIASNGLGMFQTRAIKRLGIQNYFEVILISELEDELRSEYDLKSLKVRKLGSGRKKFGEAVVRLEPDVAEMFPSADSVNEALRFSIKITRENQFPAFSKQPYNAVEPDS